MEAELAFTVAPDHPALPGHFPGHQIVPGVLVLGYVLAALERHRGPVRLTGIPQAKFLAPLAPGERCTIAFLTVSETDAKFECAVGGRTIARGSLGFEPDDGAR